ncbi:MAG: hypothetical protein K6C68_06160 [Ruminococcus sp.]|nr:hypothetical protein [Ruminococcus sp.]
MKFRLTALLLAAAVAFSFASCGKVDDDDKNKSENSVTDGYSSDEEKSISDAKKLIADWYELTNAYKYSEAVKLMTPEYASQSGFDQLADGTPSDKIVYEFIEDGVLLSMDENGDLTVEIGVELTKPDESKQVIYLSVTCYDKGPLLSGGSSAESGESTGDMTNAPDPAAQT